ncbi:hypothetical protein DERF_000041 [Dermatophagoides farinae]|uniref:Uncharacterized protein n=1 Tax=Dermatophagoides farinae TaxID=6954 RepID=A0A922L7V8_DERFA|nr:hypothetical protein DERF_000041 [Dermatophagoides farinae]
MLNTLNKLKKTGWLPIVTMVNRESAERAVKDANPIIDGRKANVNLAYLGAKPRNGFLQNGFPFSSLTRNAIAAVSTGGGPYPTFPNSTGTAFGHGSQFGFPAQPHIMYHHPGSSALAAAAAATAATTPPAATFLPSATPAGLLLTPPSAFYSDYGLAGPNTASAATAGTTGPFPPSGYPPDSGTILTTFLAPTFAAAPPPPPPPPSTIVSSSSNSGHHHHHHHQQHYNGTTGGNHHHHHHPHHHHAAAAAAAQQAMVAAAAANALAGISGPPLPPPQSSTTGGSSSTMTPTNSAAAAAAAAAFYLNGQHTTNGFLTGVITPSSSNAYLNDTRIG